MDQLGPQVGIGHERLGRIAEDRLDLRAHVRDPAAARERRIEDVDVDRGRNALDENPVARVRLGMLGERELERVTRPARIIEEPASLVNEERLTKARKDDDPDGGGIVDAHLGRVQVVDDDQGRAPEQGDERQRAMDGRRRSPGPRPRCLAKAPCCSAKPDGDDPDREEVVDQAPGHRNGDDGLAQPFNPGETDDGETGEEEVAATGPEDAADCQEGDQAGARRREVQDRVGDRDGGGEDSERRQAVAIHRQDRRGDRQEDRRGVEIDGQLLGARQAAMDGEDEGGDHGDDDPEISDIRRRRKANKARGGLDGPAQLTQGPRSRSHSDEAAKTTLEAVRPVSGACGDHQCEQSGDGRVGELPHHDLAADVGGGEDHEHAHDQEADDEDGPDGESIPDGGPGVHQRSVSTRPEVGRVRRGLHPHHAR